MNQEHDPDDSLERQEFHASEPRGRDSEHVRDCLVAVFFLGLMLFSPTVVSMFAVPESRTVLGLPVLYVYLFAAWAFVIALLALVVERSSLRDGIDEAKPNDNGVSPQ